MTRNAWAAQEASPGDHAPDEPEPTDNDPLLIVSGRAPDRVAMMIPLSQNILIHE